jgi:hypothetical protein
MVLKAGPSHSGPSLAPRIVVFLIVLFLLLLIASRLESRTWYVASDGSGDVPTIQAGVDSAAAGDTVLVGIGTYTDTTRVVVGGESKTVCARVYKNIVLASEKGPRDTVIDYSTGDVGVYVAGGGAGAVVSGFMIYRKSTDFFAAGIGAVIEAASAFERNWIVSVSYATAIHVIGTDPGAKTLRWNLLVGNAANIVLDASNVAIENNTIDGAPRHYFVEYPGSAVDCRRAANVAIRRNIFFLTYGVDCLGSPPAGYLIYEFNCEEPWILDRAAPRAPDVDEHGNYPWANPEFCSLMGVNYNYLLQSDSPCAPGNHPMDPDVLIGAFEVGCGTVAAKESTWGAVKSRFQ